MEIERLGLNDYEECLKFLKMSFNEYDHLIDFDKELPKAFRPKQELMEQNYVIKNERGIAALVGIYPMDLKVHGRTVTCATVGNVATHPDERGKGYMQVLFTEAMHEVDRRGIHLTRLGGKRQRYNRYGFEHAGVCCKYNWNVKNSESYIKENGERKLRFVPMDSPDSPLAAAAFNFYKSTDCNVDRIDTETFLCVLKAHSMEPFAAVDENGNFAGYLTASADKRVINEQYAVDSSRIADISVNWLVENNLSKAEIYFKSWDEENVIIGKYAENCLVTCPSMFRINDWKNVIEPFLDMKNRKTPLTEGKIILNTEGKSFAMKVVGSHVTCTETDEAPDISLDRLTATRLLFGHLPPELTVIADRELLARLGSWLPLPLSWSKQDNV